MKTTQAICSLLGTPNERLRRQVMIARIDARTVAAIKEGHRAVNRTTTADEELRIWSTLDTKNG